MDLRRCAAFVEVIGAGGAVSGRWPVRVISGRGGARRPDTRPSARASIACDGVIEARTERSLWLATLFALSLGWSLHPRLGLVVGAELALPIVQPRFILAADDPKDDVVTHAVALISGRILGGLLSKLQRRADG